ncbi:glycosyltransferase family 4 protein [Thioalkalivibrio sp. ALE30]|uniref:glycosyltransferase family 4 protein n=1 Tax=Thioalkalivibrio sp. ALE30 TaxID=1158181 RepID=UPI001E3E0699|nr:glycosyltransferase family 4 protein [Thioalkalivibrio sp. ALE30]
MTHANANRELVSRVCGVKDESVQVVYRGVVVPPDPGPRQKCRRILVAERLIGPKRTLDALRAFSQVAQEYPKVRLDVLGDGAERTRLEAWVRAEGLVERVRFFGHIPHHEALSRMDDAGVLLSMSQSPGERLPNVVKEAMARRCACVVSRTPGIDELVHPGYTGYIVEPGDVDAAADRLREILGDEAVMARLGEHGRRHVEEWFDLEKTTKQRIEIWESMLASGKGGAGIGER